MKDTLLTGQRKKIELITLLVCFVIANLMNLYSILKYHTPLTEMITSIFYVIIFTGALYVLWSILRLLFYGVKGLLLKKKAR